ncbi:M81 family metallopeptidase [Cohnella fermenti]|uniref:M81 family metallopeptidase n=1 Tax=Cohnella fermenti TaxID=2565925 RepID=A0A4S4BQS0_9BACL|nr:M81 family metallopeptidase [Cohnella fermenti]THF77305.1 M81 family metallopeptidase [Cohnella fermenti]
MTSEYGRSARQFAVAGLYQETNTFAPFVTELEAFASERVAGPEAFVGRYEGTRTSMGGAIAAAKQLGVELTPGFYAAATPSGTLTDTAAEELLEAVVDSVSPESDGLLLIVHGAMVAASYPDLEGELLRRLRGKLGASFPIVATIDLHGNVSADMAELADIIVGYDTYPHVDMFERAAEAFELLVGCANAEIRPARALAHTNMLVVPQAMMTEQGAMKELMERAFAMEKTAGVLNVTVAGGFPYSDVADAGMSFIVTTDGDEELAARYAKELCRMAVGFKTRFGLSALPPGEAVAAALAAPQGPIVLVEGSDNVGGGAPADATHTLACLTKLPKRALAVICDEAAVKAAALAGIGGTFRRAVGGRHDELHGSPVAVEGKVRLLSDGEYRHVGPYMTGQLAFMGHTAVVECGSLTLVLTEKRVPPWDLGHVRSVGLWPADYDIILAKSAIAWQTAFGPFAQGIVHVDSPGCCSANLAHFRYESVARPVYPLDEGEPRPRLSVFRERSNCR